MHGAHMVAEILDAVGDGCVLETCAGPLGPEISTTGLLWVWMRGVSVGMGRHMAFIETSSLSPCCARVQVLCRLLSLCCCRPSQPDSCCIFSCHAADGVVPRRVCHTVYGWDWRCVQRPWPSSWGSSLWRSLWYPIEGYVARQSLWALSAAGSGGRRQQQDDRHCGGGPRCTDGAYPCSNAIYAQEGPDVALPYTRIGLHQRHQQLRHRWRRGLLLHGADRNCILVQPCKCPDRHQCCQ